MRYVGVGLVLCVLSAAIWVAFNSWQWRHGDMESAFRIHIAAGLPPGAIFALTPGKLLVGNLSDTARLVCGSVAGVDGRSNERLYSIVIVKTLFGTAINDGFTPVTAAEHQGLSDQTCASLRADAVAHANASLN